jgi:dynein heavy chain
LNGIVAELQAQLAEKEAEYNKAMGEKNAAEAEANRCQMRLGLAQRLVNALGSENDRWAKSIEDIYL